MPGSAQSNLNSEAALHIVRRLRDAGHTAYFAGGCVRDGLLGLEPKDYDVATSAEPDEVRRIFRNSQAVGAAFGVILVRYNDQQIEVATFRADGTYSDGRRPDSVRFSSPEEDAHRRDFTINGLFLDPLTDPPTLIDFVDGRADLQSHILRAIGDPQLRLREDYLRMLRAVRFAARFDLTIEPGTAAAIRLHASDIRLISPERVGDEMRHMLTAPTRFAAWKMLRSLGLLAEVLRFLPAPEIRTLDLFHQLAPGRTVPFPLALATGILEDGLEPGSDVRSLLQPAAIAQSVRGLRQSLRMSNEESEDLESILTWSARLLDDETPGLALKRRFLATPTAALSLDLLRALAAANLHAARINILLPELTSLSQLENAPPPLLTGDDLTAAGLRPGPIFRKLLEASYDAQLEGRITSREQAIAFAPGITEVIADGTPPSLATSKRG